MATLARETVTDRTTLASNLQPLVRDGLVTVKVGTPDRRSRKISLTASGRRRVADGQAAWKRAQEQFEAAFGKTRAAEMRQVMSAVETGLLLAK